MSDAPEQFRWTVSAVAKPGPPGLAHVSVQASNSLVAQIGLDITVDWHPGAEAADVEGRALVVLSMLCKELAAECEREASVRFSEG